MITEPYYQDELRFESEKMLNSSGFAVDIKTKVRICMIFVQNQSTYGSQDLLLRFNQELIANFKTRELKEVGKITDNKIMKIIKN